MTKEKDFKFIIVTGLSGSGKTQACRFLEDLGYFVVDNLPPVFIPKFAELCRHSAGHVSRVVLVVDTRGREFFDTFVHVLDEMDKTGTPYEMIFMDASDEAIIRRYKETRRPHPLAPDARISEGVTSERGQLAPIQKERRRLESVRNKATYIIDTSQLKKVDLKEKIWRLFGSEDGRKMSINVLSFGFKFGMPLDADMVLDVRFLPNPFYVDALRKRSGTVPQVASYIESWDVTQKFEEHLDNFVDFLLPQYVKERKSQLVIAVGCTGGMHRSVFIAKHLYDRIKKHYAARLEHRDLMKNEVQEHVSEG
mgnify:CR=1 FL=1